MDRGGTRPRIDDASPAVEIDYVDATRSVRAVPSRETAPLHATSTGKACLAALPEDEREQILSATLQRFTENTLTSRARLEAELGSIGKTGYASSRGEWQTYLANIGACIRDVSGRPIGGIGVSMPAHRLARGRGEKKIGEALADAAASIERGLAE